MHKHACTATSVTTPDRTQAYTCRNASVNAVVEAQNVEDLRELTEKRMGRGTKRRRTVSSKPVVKSQAWAKYQLPGHDVVGTASLNQDYLDSAANYTTVPLSISVDLASKDRPEGLQYRVGVHQVPISQPFHTLSWPALAAIASSGNQQILD